MMVAFFFFCFFLVPFHFHCVLSFVRDLREYACSAPVVCGFSLALHALQREQKERRGRDPPCEMWGLRGKSQSVQCPASC